MARDAGDSDGTATPAALACVASGALAGPALHYTYGFVNAPPARWSNSFAYVDPEQAPLIVKRLQWLGASWIKSYENLDLARLDALKQAAREAGMGVMGHVPARLGYEEALLPDSQHLFGVPPPKSIRRDHVLNRAIDWQAVDTDRMDVVRRASVEHDLTLTPTSHLATGVLELERYEQACQESTAKALPSFFSAVAWHPVRGIPAYRNISRDDFDRCRVAIERKGELVQRLHQDGVRVLLEQTPSNRSPRPASLCTANSRRSMTPVSRVGIRSPLRPRLPPRCWESRIWARCVRALAPNSWSAAPTRDNLVGRSSGT